jgi:hypothetical protein
VKKTSRFKLVWRALCRKPTCYGIDFDGGIRLTEKNHDVLIADCVFTGRPTPRLWTRLRWALFPGRFHL